MALNEQQKKAIKWLTMRPAELGHALGFLKLTELHNSWIIDMTSDGPEDKTLQSHRGSYKTTCVALAIAIIMLLYPQKKILFVRKTATDVIEVIAQVRKILLSEYFQYLAVLIWNTPLALTKDTASEIDTNLAVADPRGTPQLLGLGTQSSVTGKHADIIFTDDIVNKEDRASRAEREKTKIFYQELQNVKNRGGHIYNTGTPWHEDDAFKLMPESQKWDCYQTGLITPEELKKIRSKMTASLFAANYELRHIASDKVIFKDPRTDADPALAEQGRCHIDASYGGEDYTAFTICHKQDGKYYILGKLWHKHVDDCLPDILALRQEYNAGRISCENNGDKGYLGKAIRKLGATTYVYHESMNKNIKITSYLKAEWDNVFFVRGTDTEYINQVCDYCEDADHDDAPDSLACAIREQWSRNGSQDTSTSNPFLS